MGNYSRSIVTELKVAVLQEFSQKRARKNTQIENRRLSRLNIQAEVRSISVQQQAQEHAMQCPPYHLLCM
jgi:hypothetical protein